MITEIGIVIGLYILTRLVPASRTRFVTVLSGVTMLVTLVVIADLVTRSVRLQPDRTGNGQQPAALIDKIDKSAISNQQFRCLF